MELDYRLGDIVECDGEIGTVVKIWPNGEIHYAVEFIPDKTFLPGYSIVDMPHNVRAIEDYAMEPHFILPSIEPNNLRILGL